MKQHHDLINAHAVVATAEMRAVDLSPQQKAYLMGMRCALAWALELPKGGRKLADMMAGIPLNGVMSPLPAEEWQKQYGKKE